MAIVAGIDLSSPEAQNTVRTVEEELNLRIKYTKQALEDLCIKKAKLETLGLSQVPYKDLTELLY